MVYYNGSNLVYYDMERFENVLALHIITYSNVEIEHVYIGESYLHFANNNYYYFIFKHSIPSLVTFQGIIILKDRKKDISYLIEIHKNAKILNMFNNLPGLNYIYNSNLRTEEYLLERLGNIGIDREKKLIYYYPTKELALIDNDIDMDSNDKVINKFIDLKDGPKSKYNIDRIIENRIIKDIFMLGVNSGKMSMIEYAELQDDPYFNSIYVKLLNENKKILKKMSKIKQENQIKL
ncbi:MAG: hypothetical protein ACTSVC_05475 [Promethearchaeota archaeon]